MNDNDKKLHYDTTGKAYYTYYDPKFVYYEIDGKTYLTEELYRDLEKHICTIYEDILYLLRFELLQDEPDNNLFYESDL